MILYTHNRTLATQLEQKYKKASEQTNTKGQTTYGFFLEGETPSVLTNYSKEDYTIAKRIFI